MKTRVFRPQDSTRVSAVMIAAFRTFLKKKFDRADREHLAPSYWRDTALFRNKFSETVSYVVEENGKVIGYIKAIAHRNGLGSLDVVGVDPSYFGKGVGHLLYRAAESFWIRKKVRKVATCVSAHNKRALLYYIKNGFIPEGYQRDHFKVGVDEIILGKFFR